MNNQLVQFYWESLGQNYNFVPNKKYLIYYPGCFCPPHRSHFNTIDDFTYLQNAKFFIHQGGREARHGVPYKLSRKIWKIYIKELMPSDKFALIGRKSHQDQIKDLCKHKFTQEADTVVFIAGNENYDPVEIEEHARNKKYKKRFEGLLKEGKEVVFLYLDRPTDGVSATKFSEALQKYSYLSYGSKQKSDKLRPYLPKGLSDKGVRYIIRKLEECDLK